MSSTIKRLGTGIAALLMTACATTPTADAPPPTARSNDCMFASTLRDWRPLDNENLILFALGRRPYHVELSWPAFGLTHDFMIGVYDRDGRICPYGGDAIIVEGPMPQRIPIRSIRQLDEQQLDAVYAQFGIHPPAIVTAEPAEPVQSVEPEGSTTQPPE